MPTTTTPKPVTPEPTPAPSKDDVISGLMERLDKQSRDIEMLKAVADKARVQNWEKKQPNPTTKIIKLSTYNGKLVTAWKTLVNEIYQDAKNMWHENQQMEVVTEDGERFTMTYLDFAKKIVKVDSELESRFTTPEGHEMMRLKFGDRTVDIDVTFVN